MKKTLLTIFCALTALFAAAQTQKNYTEPMIVTVDGTAAEPTQCNVTIIDNGNNTINFVLRDFAFVVAGQQLNVGDVNIQDVPAVQGEDGLTSFSANAAYTVPADKLPAELQPMAPLFQNLPLSLQGKMSDSKLYATLNITIDNPYLKQSISVQVGNDKFPPANGRIYTEPLVVTVNGESTEPQITDVTVISNADGTINFELKNFVLSLGGNDMGVGNIALENLTVTEAEGGLKTFAYDGSLVITEGDKAGIDTWIGPILGEIPLVLVGKMSDNKLYVTIDIDMQEAIGQIIYVQVGNDNFPPANGKIYTEPLVVTVNDVSTEPQNTDVTVIFNADGTINFELKNFVLSLGGNDMGVGNIALENLTVTEAEGGLKTFAYDGPLVITEGNKEGIDTWIGPILGEIPLVLVGKMSDDKLYVTIDIDMQEAIGQIIYVQVGTDDFAVSKKGDTNGDGNVDIADVVTVLNVMAEGTNETAADINGDGSVDIADCVTVLNIMAE